MVNEADLGMTWRAVRPVGPEHGGRSVRRGWGRACAVAAAAGVLGGAALAGLCIWARGAPAGAIQSGGRTVSESGVGSWSADHPTPQLAAAAGRPAPPAVPKGWVATWDGLVRRYYFYNQQTKETRSKAKPGTLNTINAYHAFALPSIPASHTHTHTHTNTAGIFRRRRLHGKNPRSIRCRGCRRLRLRLRLRPIGRIAHTSHT